MKRLALGLLAILPLASAQAATEPLPAKVAFQAGLHRYDANTLVVNFDMPSGYFLYNKRMAVLEVGGFEVSDVQVIGLKEINDPELGVSDVLDASSHVVLRGRYTTNGSPVNVRLKMQGCLKDTVCYPPEVRVLQTN